MRTLLLASLLTFSVLNAETTPQNLLTVTGEGKTTVQANIADVQIAIASHRKTAADTQLELADKLKPILEKLKNLSADKLETGSMQIHPEYDKDNSQKLIGYKGHVNLQFSTSSANAGSLIDAAIAAGANELTSITLRASDNELRDAELKALELACNDATTKANTILKTLKLENKGISQVTTEPHSNYPSPRSYAFAAMAKNASTLEVTDQEQSITSQIQLQIRIN